MRSFSDLRVLVFHLDLIKKFIKRVVILKGRHIWWSAYHNSDICLGGGILKTSLIRKVIQSSRFLKICEWFALNFCWEWRKLVMSVFWTALRAFSFILINVRKGEGYNCKKYPNHKRPFIACEQFDFNINIYSSIIVKFFSTLRCNQKLHHYQG